MPCPPRNSVWRYWAGSQKLILLTLWGTAKKWLQVYQKAYQIMLRHLSWIWFLITLSRGSPVVIISEGDPTSECAVENLRFSQFWKACLHRWWSHNLKRAVSHSPQHPLHRTSTLIFLYYYFWLFFHTYCIKVLIFPVQRNTENLCIKHHLKEHGKEIGTILIAQALYD